MTTNDHHSQHQPCCTNAAGDGVAVSAIPGVAERKRAVQGMVRLLARITAQQILEERRAAIRKLPEPAKCSADSGGSFST